MPSNPDVDIPSRLMIVMAIRIRLPLWTGVAPTVGVGVGLLVLHSGTAQNSRPTWNINIAIEKETTNWYAIMRDSHRHDLVS